MTNLGVLQALGHDVRPHLMPLDDVSTELCVPTHGSRAISLVEALVDVLRRQAQMLVLEHLEDGRGSHRGRVFVGDETRRFDCDDLSRRGM